MVEATFWLAFGIIAYVYVGYPFLLWVVSRFREPPRVVTPAQWPRVTLVISAYNEERSIRQKIENTLSIDYPQTALEVLVVSDASSDRTELIVDEFAGQGVQLLRMRERGGK